MLFSGLIEETALATFLCYCPGLDIALRFYPLEPEWWILPMHFSLIIWLYDEFRRYMIRSYPGGRENDCLFFKRSLLRMIMLYTVATFWKSLEKS